MKDCRRAIFAPKLQYFLSLKYQSVLATGSRTITSDQHRILEIIRHFLFELVSLCYRWIEITEK